MNFNSILIGSEDPGRLAEYYTKLFGKPAMEEGGYTSWMIGSAGGSWRPPCSAFALASAAHGITVPAEFGSRQRIGGAYCRPPWVHSLFRPRSIFSAESLPTLRSKLSP